MPSVIRDILSRQAERASGVSALADSGRPITHAELMEKVRAASFSGQFLPFFDRFTEETFEHRQAYRTMLKSPVVKAALLGKIYAIASLDLSMVAASDEPRDREVADCLTYAYTQGIEGGLRKIVESILYHGFIDGTAICEKVWHKELWPRGKWAGKRFFRDLKAKDLNGLALIIDEFKNITGVKAMRYGQTTAFPAADFVIFRNQPLFEGGGLSDFRAAYAAFWRLTTVEKIRAMFLERYARGMLIGKYKDDKDRDPLEAELAKASDRHYLVAPDTVLVELINLASSNGEAYAAAVRDYKEDIALAIAGAFLQFLTANSGSGDIRGDSQTQKSTAELFVWHGAAVIQGLIDHQMTPDLVAENYAGADYPTCKLGGINDADLAQSIPVDQGLRTMGFPLSKKELAKRYNRTMATDPNDQLPPPGGPGGGFPGGGNPPGGGLGPGGAGGGVPAGFPFSESSLFAEGDYHGPTAPGPDWQQVGVGPNGGKIWRRVSTATGQNPAAGDKAGGAPAAATTPEQIQKTGLQKAKEVLGKFKAKADAIADKIPVVGHAKRGLEAVMGRVQRGLAKRYGERTANLILASGTVLDFATLGVSRFTFPAASVVYSIPAVVLAEAVHQIGNLRKHAEGEPGQADLPADQLQQLGREVAKFLATEWAKALEPHLAEIQRLPATFADDGGTPTRSQPAGDQVAMAGADGRKAEQLLAEAKLQGATTLTAASKSAVARLLTKGASALRAKGLFTEAELGQVAAQIRDTNAMAELLGRSRIQERAERAEQLRGSRKFSEEPTSFRVFDEAGGLLEPLPPARAIDYFRKLVPRLDISDPGRWGALLEREAFTLARAAEQVILEKVQDLIQTRLESGEGIGTAPGEIAQVLDAAGVGEDNAQYAEMVFRTNMMDSYNQGAERELAEVSDTFPVWRYANPDDGRSRPAHAARVGRYYSSATPFAKVRGTDIGDVANCRCTFIPIDKYEWAELQQQGAKIESYTFAESAAPADSDDADSEEADRLRAEIIVALFGEQALSLLDQLGGESRFAGFTGWRTDRIGRKTYWQDGKRVKAPTTEVAKAYEKLASLGNGAHEIDADQFQTA